MTREHKTTLVLDYPTAERARAVAESVAREAGEIAGDRTTATVEREDRRVTVRLVAADLVALRAGGNTWLSLLDVAERAAEAGERSERSGSEQS